MSTSFNFATSRENYIISLVLLLLVHQNLDVFNSLPIALRQDDQTPRTERTDGTPKSSYPGERDYFSSDEDGTDLVENVFGIGENALVHRIFLK